MYILLKETFLIHFSNGICLFEMENLSIEMMKLKKIYFFKTDFLNGICLFKWKISFHNYNNI